MVFELGELYIVEIIPDALNVCFSWITNNK